MFYCERVCVCVVRVLDEAHKCSCLATKRNKANNSYTIIKEACCFFTSSFFISFSLSVSFSPSVRPDFSVLFHRIGA